MWWPCWKISLRKVMGASPSTQILFPSRLIRGKRNLTVSEASTRMVAMRFRKVIFTLQKGLMASVGIFLRLKI